MRVALGFTMGGRGAEPLASNEAIAEEIKKFNPDVISVQWEIGTALRKRGITPAHEVRKRKTPSTLLGLIRYELDTEEVARQMAQYLKDHDLLNENIHLFAHKLHRLRCIVTLRGFSIEALPVKTEIPLDPHSSLIWTRNETLLNIYESLQLFRYRLKGY